MKVKPQVKIVLILLVAVGAFFLIRNKVSNKKATETVSVSNIDSTANVLPDTTANVAKTDGVAVGPVKVAKPVVREETTSAAPTKAKVIKPTAPKIQPKEVHKAPVKAKKPGERENLELSN